MTAPRQPGWPALDVHAWIGAYPWRRLPHPDPDVLVRVLEREGLARAWVGHLPSAFYREPSAGNTALYGSLTGYREQLVPAPAVRPDWPGWEREIARAVGEGARAVRAYPMHWGLGPGHAALTDLAHACAGRGLSLLLTVRFEDARQRHPLDVAGDLTAAHVRDLARARTGARIVVAAAGRAMIEEVHWGLTPDERERVHWDFSWVWGPPEDDFAHLLRTLGADRFVYGTGWPLRLTQNSRANLALLPEVDGVPRLASPESW